MVGSAVTLRFVPHRPDIALDKPKGESSAEYEAFELCGPSSILVMASVGPWESVGQYSVITAQQFTVLLV